MIGRRRKPGRRYPNGELAHNKEDVRTIALAQPHRRALPSEQRLDQRAEHPLGGLNLVGVISNGQYQAGKTYARIVARYRRMILAPKMSPPSRLGDMEIRRGEGESRTISPTQARRIKETYDNAFAILWNAGQRAARAVAHVAVYDRACPRGDIEHLRRGLTALAEHFGLG